MTLRESSRLAKINPFRVMSVSQRARVLEAQGREIIHLEIGEPDFATALPIIAAAHSALEQGHTQYSNASGIMPLKEAIAAHYENRYGVQISTERIFVTPGASGGLNLLANMLIEVGDEILMGDPAYPCNRNLVRLMGGSPCLVPVGPEVNFQPTVPLLKSQLSANTSGVWLASPANPTGATLDRKSLTELSAWASDEQLNLVADEIYQGIQYSDDVPSALEVDSTNFVVNSFSKYFGMTGWRIGWLVVPDDYAEMANVLAQNLYISASSISQYAALAAFLPETMDIFEQRREEFENRRNFLLPALKDLGFELPTKPDGAFYLYANVSRFSDDCEQFCHRLLEENGIAITPGTDFGLHNARHYVRFAFTTSLENIKIAVDRLSSALA